VTSESIAPVGAAASLTCAQTNDKGRLARKIPSVVDLNRALFDLSITWCGLSEVAHGISFEPAVSL
jgi:hypothetical protein